MQARAAAVDELVVAGTLEDYTSTGTELDRELAKVSASQQVNEELERMKAEVGAGEQPKELEEKPSS
jgi:phage shock protein A